VPFAEFERDAAAGTLPDLALIEPNLLAGHGDYHPASGRALLPGIDVAIDPPSSILAGKAFLARIYGAVSRRPRRPGRTPSTPRGSSAGPSRGAPTTTSHRDRSRRPTRARRPDSSASASTSRYRVPAIIGSPWVDQATVVHDEYRHISRIATLRQAWDLGPPLTGRDAVARAFSTTC
jgi:phospholipase C